jgi:hypothetical protein
MNECDLNQHCYLDPCDYQIRTPLESFLLERLPTTPLRKLERAVRAVKAVKAVRALAEDAGIPIAFLEWKEPVYLH